MAGEGGLAEEIRARLEGMAEPKVEAVSNFLDEVWFRKTKRQHLQEFAQVFALVFLLMAGLSAYKRGPNIFFGANFSAALVTLALGYLRPQILHPLWKGWMAVGHYLGAVMSVVILTIAWTVMVIPIGVLLKIFRIKVLDTSFGASQPTYWENRDPKHNDFALLKRQF